MGQSKESLLIIEWVFLTHMPSKSITTPQELMVQLIRKARFRLHVLAVQLRMHLLAF